MNTNLGWAFLLSASISACAMAPGVRRPAPRTNVVLLNPKTPIPAISADALMLAAHKAYQVKNYSKSYDYYLAAAAKYGETPKALEANYRALRCAGKLNRHPETVEIADQLLRNKSWTEGQLIEINQYKLRALELEGRYLEALLQIQVLAAIPGLAKDVESLRLRSQEFIQSRLNREDLEVFTSDSADATLKSLAYFRLAEMSLEERDSDQARSFLSRSISASPSSEFARRSADLLSQLDAVKRVEPKTIGVVLPLTGKYASISQKTLRGVQMGLGLYGANQTSFKLAVADSEGNPDGARVGVEKLVKEDNIIAVIGSVLSKTAPAVAAKANELGVPSVALSQKFGITELGANVFRNSLTSEMQVRALVKTAMEEMGLKKFAILYPNDQYGIEYTNLFWDEVLARGGTITGAQIYAPKETDFREPIQRLIGTYYIEARADEYKMRLKEWGDAQTKRSARNLPPDDLLPSVVDFDAIFIPDSSKALGQISAMLSYNGVKGIQLLGTNLWNVPGIAKRAGNSAAQTVFVDSFVSSDPRFTQSTFVRDYRNEFGEEPGVFEIQAYDAALMLRQLIAQGATSRESLSNSLARMNGFPGSLGLLSMTSDREVQRPLLALTIENGNIVPFLKPTQK
jgi:ABC-type branched-subunit amino acid transport system substrate-binding protein